MIIHPLLELDGFQVLQPGGILLVPARPDQCGATDGELVFAQPGDGFQGVFLEEGRVAAVPLVPLHAVFQDRLVKQAGNLSCVALIIRRVLVDDQAFIHGGADAEGVLLQGIADLGIPRRFSGGVEYPDAHRTFAVLFDPLGGGLAPFGMDAASGIG